MRSSTVLLLLFPCLPLFAAIPVAPNPPKPADPQADAAPEIKPKGEPSIEDFAWLAGHWRGEGFGGVCEEVWSAPLAGTMMGTFRLVRDDEVQFYEIMLLGRDERGFSLEVKHFSKDFVAWEEKGDAVRFDLESVGESSALFESLKMDRTGDDLAIEILMERGGTSSWQKIALRRYAPDSEAR
jgi:hypothetical protein